jgi:hypothetical protein
MFAYQRSWLLPCSPIGLNFFTPTFEYSAASFVVQRHAAPHGKTAVAQNQNISLVLDFVRFSGPSAGSIDSIHEKSYAPEGA